jgi:hypothetical protein
MAFHGFARAAASRRLVCAGGAPPTAGFRKAGGEGMALFLMCPIVSCLANSPGESPRTPPFEETLYERYQKSFRNGVGDA